MNRIWLAVPPLALTLSLALSLSPSSADEKKPVDAKNITWKKTVLDKVFRAEGVAVADVNKDGKMDILNGEFWYEAPDWKPHEIRKPGDYGDGSHGYSQSFACWADDINGDGYPDLVVVGFPGAPAHWFENPRGGTGHWKQHEIWHSACNETPQYVDLFGDGKHVLLMGYQQKGRDAGQMAYFTPGNDPTKTWEMHPISEVGTPREYKITDETLKKLTAAKVDEKVVEKLRALKDQQSQRGPFYAAVDKALDKKERAALGNHLEGTAVVPGSERQIPGTNRFDHGLGIGDVNGDGKQDVIVTGGWWEQPAKVDGKTPWTFHPGRTSDACADMYALDIDGDGKPDLLSSSAHGQGIWWHKQTVKDGKSTFTTRPLFPDLVSQTHAMVMADINGDGLKDFVTGKRFWAHGPKGDINPGAPAKVYWFEAKKGNDGFITFTPHEIDDDSGIGTQFTVADVNGDGLLDVVTSNKKGTFLLEQVRAK
jgi:FG-GAP-like repeat/FG-GAP repeat